jgi:hypothetical protein
VLTFELMLCFELGFDAEAKLSSARSMPKLSFVQLAQPGCMHSHAKGAATFVGLLKIRISIEMKRHSYQYP